MTDWSIPNLSEPWDPAAEIPYLCLLTALVEFRWPRFLSNSNFSIEGAFVEIFFACNVCNGQACVYVLDSGEAHFSCYLRNAEDKFHDYSI